MAAQPLMVKISWNSETGNWGGWNAGLCKWVCVCCWRGGRCLIGPSVWACVSEDGALVQCVCVCVCVYMCVYVCVCVGCHADIFYFSCCYFYIFVLNACWFSVFVTRSGCCHAAAAADNKKRRMCIMRQAWFSLRLFAKEWQDVTKEVQRKKRCFTLI